MAVSTLMAGRIYDRTGITPIVLTGTVMLSVGSAIGICFQSNSSLLQIGIASGLLSAGSGFLSSSLTTAALGQLEGRDRVDGSAILNTLRQVASSFASIFAITINTIVSTKWSSDIIGVQGVYVCYIGVCVLFLFVARGFCVHKYFANP